MPPVRFARVCFANFCSSMVIGLVGLYGTTTLEMPHSEPERLITSAWKTHWPLKVIFVSSFCKVVHLYGGVGQLYSTVDSMFHHTLAVPSSLL